MRPPSIKNVYNLTCQVFIFAEALEDDLGLIQGAFENGGHVEMLSYL
jgi:hypothetical protein